MREGEAALKNKILPCITRDSGQLEVGEAFVADGKVTTFDIISPYTSKRQKATLIMHMDWYSGYIAGFELMLTENTQAVASSLRSAILTLGRTCKVAVQDNGKSFRNKFFKGSPRFEECGFYGLFGRLGIIPYYPEAYNARAKVIERFWQWFVESFEKLMPSFTGTSPAEKDRPAYTRRNEKFHKALKGEGEALTIEEAKDLIVLWLDFYHSQQCPRERGKSIKEVFDAGRTVLTQEDQFKLEFKLNDLMMNIPEKLYQVRNACVTLFNYEYYSPELVPLAGRMVQIRYSLFDLSYMNIHDKDGRYICRAERKQTIHPLARLMESPKDSEELRRQTAEMRRLRKDAKKKTLQLMATHENAAAVHYLGEPKTNLLNDRCAPELEAHTEEPEPINPYTIYTED